MKIGGFATKISKNGGKIILHCVPFAIWVITMILQFANLQMRGGLRFFKKPEVISRVIVSINYT